MERLGGGVTGVTPSRTNDVSPGRAGLSGTHVTTLLRRRVPGIPGIFAAFVRFSCELPIDERQQKSLFLNGLFVRSAEI
jgi:hypothetical protein